MCKAVREIRDEGRIEGRTEDIRNIIKNLKMTAEEAMDVLEIKEEDRERLLAIL